MKAVRRPLVFFGWIIVAASFITVAIAVSVRFVFSIFYVAMIEDLGGVGRTAYSTHDKNSKVQGRFEAWALARNRCQ